MMIFCDVEADGPCPGLFSMTEVGAVVYHPSVPLSEAKTFHGKFAPISDRYDQRALDVTGYSRGETMQFPDPRVTTEKFYRWLIDVQNEYRTNRLIFVSDNNGFDWQFVNYYFHKFCGTNPFGFSSMNLGSLWKGLDRNLYSSFKHLRKTKHDHNPVNDAMGNAEAFDQMFKVGNIKGNVNK